MGIEIGFMKYITKSEEETFVLAQEFAGKLVGGEVLCLIGDLGAGKTALTKGLAKGLGVKNIITSPTFVLLKPYSAKLNNINKLVHIDAYRLDSGAELEYIGADEYFKDKKCVTVIEWADRVKDIWPKDVIEIRFKIISEDRREITIK